MLLCIWYYFAKILLVKFSGMKPNQIYIYSTHLSIYNCRNSYLQNMIMLMKNPPKNHFEHFFFIPHYFIYYVSRIPTTSSAIHLCYSTILSAYDYHGNNNQHYFLLPQLHLLLIYVFAFTYENN